MRFKIITDSTSDVTKEFAERYNIDVLPLQVIFDGEAYKATDITNEEFYARLNDALAKGQKLPTTSQITEEEFTEALAPHANTEDEFVCMLLISQEISGTYLSASKAIEALGMKNVYLPETRKVTFGLGIIVAEAAKLAMREDLTVEEFKSAVDDLIDRAVIYASIGDLRCLRAGGRLSAAAMALGMMLKLKPIIYIDGKVEMATKVISQGKATRWIVDKVASERDDAYPVYLGSSQAPEILNEFRTKFKDVLRLTGDEEEFPLGPVVGVHAGPGCAGIAFIRKK
ncbi:MAG: DegV family protein [Christensenellaceae bacterium]